MSEDRCENGSRTHEPDLREAVSNLDALKALVDEKEKRYDAEFKHQTELAKLAIASLADTVKAAFAAAEKANDKSDAAQHSYNVDHNGVLKRMDDMLPRKDFEAAMREVAARLDRMDADMRNAISNSKREAAAELKTVQDDIRSLRESRSAGGGEKSGEREGGADLKQIKMLMLGAFVSLLCGLLGSGAMFLLASILRK